TNVKVRPPARVPFELHLNSLIFLQARVNGSEPMWFVLDSASTFSFLDAGKAEALGIRAENRDSITGSGGGSIEIAFGKRGLFRYFRSEANRSNLCHHAVEE